MNPLLPPNRSQAVSPISTNGSEWSGINGYGAMPRSKSPFSPHHLPAPTSDRGQVNGGKGSAPEASAAGLPASARRPSVPASQLSSPSLSASNARSSDGTLSDQQSVKYRRMEEQLLQHYDVLKRYLNGGQQQSPQPNKARDKLLRLSATQFHELSTDVYDELSRRQAANPPRPPPGRPPPRTPNVPPYLLPRSDFHEKRNQARQKLSSLQPPRFRDLATDVFCELERRFPQFRQPGGPRQRSPGSNGFGGFPPRGPSSMGRRLSPSAQNGLGGASRNFLDRGPGSSPGPRSSSSQLSGVEPSPRGSSLAVDNGNPEEEQRVESEYGKPLPKQFQSSTMTPNKSTMVEDDEDDFAMYEEQYDGTPKGDSLADVNLVDNEVQISPTPNPITAGDGDSRTKEMLDEAESKVQELNCKVDELQVDLSLKDDEIAKMKESEQNLAAQEDWQEVRQKLEAQLEDAQMLNQSMKDQLDRIHTDQANVERDLRSQLDQAKRHPPVTDGGWKEKHQKLEREHQALQAKFQDQQRVTEEVRQEASDFLQEMRTLSQGGGANFEREEELGRNVRRLEEQVKEWKSRYARSKAQLRNLRATSMGFSMSRPDMARYAKANEFSNPNGLVKDIYITKFQISIDELLRISRMEDPTAVLAHMKSVVIAVRGITQDIKSADDASSAADEAVQRQLRLKSKVSVTANNVITASKNFASSNGLSPVSLLDAAASHLTMAVVELVRVVKIRPTPSDEWDEAGEPNEEDLEEERAHSPTYFNVEPSHMRSVSGNASVYSAMSEPPVSAGSSASNTIGHPRSESKTDSGSTEATTFGDLDEPDSACVAAGFSLRESDNGAVEDLKVRDCLLLTFIHMVEGTYSNSCYDRKGIVP